MTQNNIINAKVLSLFVLIPTPICSTVSPQLQCVVCVCGGGGEKEVVSLTGRGCSRDT